MGTLLVVTAWGWKARDSATILAALHAARDSVRLVDSLMSNYRAMSELSMANRSAGGDPVRVSPQFMYVLEKARQYWRLSGGAFDPTIGPLVGAWGFYGETGRIPPSRELDSLRSLVNFAAVEVDTRARTVRLPRAGMKLDFGGIAKGYALDLARAALGSPVVSGAMIDLGGNVLVFGRPPSGDRWRIGIRHPCGEGRRDRTLGVVAVDSGAVATSGDYEHFYMIGGRRYSHLIDPRTGRPARGVIAATAVGPRGEWSDGLSAALFLAGPERGLRLADSLPDVGALYVLDSGDRVIARRDVVLSKRAREWFEFDAEVK
jgi:FAD:protein FMN transferase